MAPVVKQFEWEQVSCVHYILPNKTEPDPSRGIHLSCGLGISPDLHSKMDYPLIYHRMDEPPFLLGLSAHFSHKHSQHSISPESPQIKMGQVFTIYRKRADTSYKFRKGLQ